MVDNPSTLALIPSALRVITSTLPQQKEPWVILPGKSVHVDYRPLTLGRDQLDNVLVLPTACTETFITRLPNVNINSSSKSPDFCEVVDGVYIYVAHYHRWKQDGESHPAFFIQHFSSEGPSHLRNLEDAYLSPERINLPRVGGGYDSYINFHRSDKFGDGSLGCWTAPKGDFDAFRSMYKPLQWGIVIKATSNPDQGLKAIQLIRRAYV